MAMYGPSSVLFIFTFVDDVGTSGLFFRFFRFVKRKRHVLDDGLRRDVRWRRLRDVRWHCLRDVRWHCLRDVRRRRLRDVRWRCLRDVRRRRLRDVRRRRLRYTPYQRGGDAPSCRISDDHLRPHQSRRSDGDAGGGGGGGGGGVGDDADDELTSFLHSGTIFARRVVVD